MITPVFGIESGISYTLLMSNVNSGGEECYYDEDRTLHYMGVPVNLVWNAWSGERLSCAGLQYNLSRRAGLYVEPGMGYYFDNGSETETAYSRRPLNFNLNMGVRISFR